MGELDYPQGSHEWAWEKGIERKCSDCGREYDPNIGCTTPKCSQKRLEKEIRRRKEAEEHEEKKRRLKNVFDNVIWPDK